MEQRTMNTLRSMPLTAVALVALPIVAATAITSSPVLPAVIGAIVKALS